MTMKVGTHNGVFHADDVFGYCILKAAFYDDIEIARTIDPNVLQNCDLVFDVGGGKYDHHQVDKNIGKMVFLMLPLVYCGKNMEEALLKNGNKGSRRS